MATYDYACPRCGATESIKMTFAEYEDLKESAHPGTSGVTCTATEDCGEMRRLYSPPGINVK